MVLQFSDELAVVMVVLCDYTMRKFQRRVENVRKKDIILDMSIKTNLAPPNQLNTADEEEYINPFLTHVEDALHRCRTKLSAAHARSRIRARVLSIESLLPSNVRQNEQLASHMHVSSWVNYSKTRFHNNLLVMGRGGVLDGVLAFGFDTSGSIIRKTFVLQYLLDPGDLGMQFGALVSYATKYQRLTQFGRKIWLWGNLQYCW